MSIRIPRFAALAAASAKRPKPWDTRTETQRNATNGTCYRQSRWCGMKQGHIWYVAFGPATPNENASSSTRSTRTFKSEVDAKLFAMQILSRGWTASAGTLNPHQPKQIVPPSQIERWADPGLGG